MKTREFRNLIINIIGLFVIIRPIYSLIKEIINRTETSIISNEARKVIGDKDKALALRRAIDKYHILGDWSKTGVYDVFKGEEK